MNIRNAQKRVEKDYRLKLGLVQTLLPNTVELVVKEMLSRVHTATINLVRIA